MEVANIFTIADLDNMQVIGDVDEADIGQVKVGQNVTFTVDAYPEDLFSGKVTQVRLNPTTESNVVTYEVVVSTSNADHKLIPGLTANLTIHGRSRRYSRRTGRGTEILTQIIRKLPTAPACRRSSEKRQACGLGSAQQPTLPDSSRNGCQQWCECGNQVRSEHGRHRCHRLYERHAASNAKRR